MSEIAVDWSCPKCGFRHETIGGCCANVCPSCNYLRSVFQKKQTETDAEFTRLRVDNERLQREIRARVAKVIHCENCGGSWYDDGFNAKCPCFYTAIVVRVEDVGGMARAIHKGMYPGMNYDSLDKVEYEEIARTVREYLKGGG